MRRLPLLLLTACEAGSLESTAREPWRTNVLLIIADDMGVEKVGAYGVGDRPAPTPTLDALAARGVIFDRAWSDPVCSPTRATLLTGEHAFRSGVGNAIQIVTEDIAVPEDAPSIARMLSPDYATAVAGKWHLASLSAGAHDHPQRMGFDWHSGAPGNLIHVHPDGGDQDYFRWMKLVQGTFFATETYATTDTVNDAVALTGAMEEPWFLWLAFNAPHYPFHEPPAELHTRTLGPQSTYHDRYDAMVEAMDTELARLFATMDPDVLANTTIVFIGDNGSPDVTGDFYDPVESKGHVWEGGTRVPFIVAGPPVAAPGTRTDALVHTVDFYATVAEIAGVDPSSVDRWPQDSVSFLQVLERPDLPPPREWVYSETFHANGPPPWDIWERAVRDDRYKLMRHPTFGDRLYDLGDRWKEPGPLSDEVPGAREARQRLEGLLDAIQP